MTQNHFIALAQAIANLPSNPSKTDVLFAIAGVCQSFNPGFDFNRFRDACSEN